MASIAFPVAFLALGVEYVLIGIKVVRDGGDDVERGFAFFVICIGIAGILLSGTELLRSSPLTGAWLAYFLAIGSYGTPILYAVASVAWFAFATRYVATVSVRFRSLVAALAAPVIVLMPLATTMTHLTDGDGEAFPLLAEEVTPLLKLAAFVVAPYHFAIALAGVAVVLWAVYRYGQPSLKFAALLYIGGPFWYFSNYVTAPVFGVSNDVFFGINLLIGGIGLAALWRIHRPARLHQERPAASVLGRDEVVDGLDDPIVAIDRFGQVADVNTAATSVFEAGHEELRGRPVDDTVPEWMDESAVRTPGTHEQSTDDGRILRVTVSEITDDADRAFGRVAVFRDVTDDRRRGQRLQVLNRVLRHNLRNEGNFINGTVKRLANDPEDRDRHEHRIRERVRKLIDVGEKARTIENLVQADRRQESFTPVRRIARQAVDRAGADSDATVTVDGPESIATFANDVVLEAMLTELVENAFQHADHDRPSVTIRHEIGPSGDLEIGIADDGPGIPDYETAVLEKGEESPLEHGSGIGLWLVKWGSERLGGDLQFETPSSGGTRVVLELPAELVVDDPDESEARRNSSSA